MIRVEWKNGVEKTLDQFFLKIHFSLNQLPTEVVVFRRKSRDIAMTSGLFDRELTNNYIIVYLYIYIFFFNALRRDGDGDSS